MGAIEKSSGNILRGLETKSAKLDSQTAEVREGAAAGGLAVARARERPW
jgi:hypothetical protein